MKNIRVIVSVTALGIALAVGCGDDTESNNPTPGEAGDGSGGSSGSGGKNVGGSSSPGGKNGTDGGAPSNAGVPSTGDAGVGQGGGPVVPGCGDAPACDEDTQECVGGQCLTVDGEACLANEDCVHTCINELCAPRSEVLGDCDYQGAGGAGGAGGADGVGGAGGGAEGGSGGEGGEGIYVPPEEIGNGDDLDCLDGLACDSGTCKRKQMTDCTGPEQCLSGLCHKSKCTLGPADAGVCEANLCGAPTNSVCAPTTTAVNNCSFNYLPNSSCVVDFKGTYCYQTCACQLAP